MAGLVKPKTDACRSPWGHSVGAILAFALPRISEGRGVQLDLNHELPKVGVKLAVKRGWWPMAGPRTAIQGKQPIELGPFVV